MLVTLGVVEEDDKCCRNVSEGVGGSITCNWTKNIDQKIEILIEQHTTLVSLEIFFLFFLECIKFFIYMY